MVRLGFCVMVGVVPGYGHENKELTIGNAYKIGKETWKEVTQEISNMQSDIQNPQSENFYKIDAIVIPALAVYSKDFGCPIGGEVGIQIESIMKSGQNKELYRKSAIETIKMVMAKLNQNTATIEWLEGKTNKGTTYISEAGNKIDENSPLDGIEHFTVALMNVENTNEEYVRVGRAIQDAAQLISNTNTGNADEKYYIISGIITPILNRAKQVQFSASQNPIYGQTNNELYRQTVIKTVQEVMKALGQKKSVINFCQRTVKLNLNDILKMHDNEDEIDI